MKEEERVRYVLTMASFNYEHHQGWHTQTAWTNKNTYLTVTGRRNINKSKVVDFDNIKVTMAEGGIGFCMYV